jgi:glycosyltransferase involved in cell wall biosynthesis
MPIQVSDTYQDSKFAQRQTGLLFNLPVPDPGVLQLPEGISLCMIVKNEERFLPECLDSLKDVVDEINICDTGSTDRTVEIAHAYGANVIHREWRNDFAWAKNEALAMATRRWTIVLDADEELAPDSVQLVRSLRTVPADTTSVYIRIVNHTDDYTGRGTLTHNLPRIFPTNPRIRYRNVIHEGLTLDGGEISGILTPIRIFHKGYTVAVLKAKDKSKRNVPLLEQAVNENGEDPFALFNFGVCAISGDNGDVGIASLEKMFDVCKGGKPKIYFPLAYMMLASGYSDSRHDNEKALEILDTGLETFPDDANMLFTKSQILLRAKKYDESIATATHLLDLRQQAHHSAMVDDEIFEWKALYTIVAAYVGLDDVSKALEYLELSLKNKPDAPFLLISKCRALEKLEHFHDAEIAFRRLAAVDGGNGLVEYVNFMLRRKRYSTALSLVENDLATASPAVAAHLNFAAARAMEADGLGDPVPFLEAALRYAPAHGQVIGMLERIYMERGNTEALEQLHRDELLATCEQPNDFVRRSYRLLELGWNEDAKQAASCAIRLQPDIAQARFNCALAALRLGEEELSLSELNEIEPVAIDIFPTAMSMRASILERRGDLEGALESTSRLLTVEPRNADAVLQHAKLLIHAGRDGDARTVLEPLAVENKRVAVELAGILLRAGDIAGAGLVATLALQ